MYPVTAPRDIPGLSQEWRRRLGSFYRAVTWMSPRLSARLALELFTVPGRPPLGPGDVRVMARARSLRLPCAGRCLQGYEWGRQGQAVLLMHGWGSRVARLSGFVEPLRELGFRVVGVDAPGHGRSTGWRADLQGFCTALATGLQAFEPVAGIVAHSYGARATVRYLAEHPGHGVRAIALLGIPPDVRYMMEQFKLVLELRDDVQALLLEQYVKTFGRLPDVHSVTEPAAILESVVLVVHDELDEVAPVIHPIEFVKQLPRAAMLLTRGLGHCGPPRDRATIRRIAEFLRASCARELASAAAVASAARG